MNNNLSKEENIDGEIDNDLLKNGNLPSTRENLSNHHLDNSNNLHHNFPYTGYTSSLPDSSFPSSLFGKVQESSSDRKRSRRVLHDDSVDDILGLSKKS